MSGVSDRTCVEWASPCVVDGLLNGVGKLNISLPDVTLIGEPVAIRSLRLSIASFAVRGRD